jgi:hypothetical protein
MNNEQNTIKAVATTDGQLVVMEDNFGFHVVPAPRVIDALHPYLIAKSNYFAHYGRTNNNRVMIDVDPTEFGYPANLTRLVEHFAPELWARFVDKTVSSKPGILEQLKPETNG